MPTVYVYDFWNGRALVGSVSLPFPLQGTSVTFGEYSALKRPYTGKIGKVVLPVRIIQISDDGITVVYKLVLDIRRKTKRQLEVVLKASV